MEKLLERIKILAKIHNILEDNYIFKIDNGKIIIQLYVPRVDGRVVYMSGSENEKLMVFAARNLKDCMLSPIETKLIISKEQPLADMSDEAFELWFKLEYGE